MLVRSRVMRARTLVLAAVVASIVPFFAGGVAAPAANAGVVADDPQINATSCPTGTAVSSFGEWPWTTMIQRPGVAMCHTPQYQLTVIDTSLGGKLRVVSQHANTAGIGLGESWAEFWNRDAAEWAAYIRNGGVIVPGASRLFNVINAGFMVDVGTATTRLSMPEMRDATLQSAGWALEGTDPAWRVPKRMVRIGDPYRTPQIVSFGDFGVQDGPNIGSYSKLTTAAAFVGFTDATVGFVPWHSPGDEGEFRPRTMMGYDFITGRIWIMVATGRINPPPLNSGVTLQEAWRELTKVGADWVIQLDGGRSSQWWSPALNYGWRDPATRDVPEVLAVYSG